MQERQIPAVIEKLDLSRRKLDDDQLLVELKALATVKTVRELDLSFNRITDDGIKHLINLIKQGITVSSLDLTGNPITNTVLEKLSKLKLKECHLNSIKADITGLACFQNNQTILHLAYDRTADHEMYAQISANIETQLQRNRQNFRANLILRLIECCKIYLQKGTVFNQLPKPVFFVILVNLGEDYQHAYQYSQNFQTPLQLVCKYLLNSLTDLRIHKKMITPPKTPTLFYRACKALPLGNDRPHVKPFDSVAVEQEKPSVNKAKNQCVIC